MISLAIFLFRIIVLVVLVFGFVVLFEHGTGGVLQGIPLEAEKLIKFVGDSL